MSAVTTGHWFAREHTHAFYVYSPNRDFAHIRLVYGDHSGNIPNYGTKDEARADAEFIAAALNKRDGTTPRVMGDNK